MKELTSSKLVVPSNVARRPSAIHESVGGVGGGGGGGAGGGGGGGEGVSLPLTALSPRNTWWGEGGQAIPTPHLSD